MYFLSGNFFAAFMITEFFTDSPPSLQNNEDEYDLFHSDVSLSESLHNKVLFLRFPFKYIPPFVYNIS